MWFPMQLVFLVVYLLGSLFVDLEQWISNSSYLCIDSPFVVVSLGLLVSLFSTPVVCFCCDTDPFVSRLDLLNLSLYVVGPSWLSFQSSLLSSSSYMGVIPLFTEMTSNESFDYFIESRMSNLMLQHIHLHARGAKRILNVQSKNLVFQQTNLSVDIWCMILATI